mgnify:CR=1 FL=1
MKSILFKKLSYNITRITLSVLASVAVMTMAAYAASTIGTNFSADGTLSVTATSTLSSDLRVDTNTLVVDSFNDKVGIGTTSPYAKLSVGGDVVADYFHATSTTATSTFAGGLDLTSSTGMGLNFGSNTLFYQNNQIFLTSSTTSAGNLTIGYQTPTGIDANGGLNNTGVGYQAMKNATSTNYNTALGYQALSGSATVSNTGSNTAVGYRALLVNTTGNNNTALGYYAIRSNSTGSNNNAVGYQSFYYNTTGVGNTSIGHNTGLGTNTPDQRSSIDNYMTFIGYQSSRDASIASATALSNGIAIGKNARVAQSNAMVLGGTGSDAINVAIGTTSPWAKLSIMNTYGSQTPLFDIATSTSAAYATSSIFRVNANGNVGIGTTTPQAKLHISNGASATTTVTVGELGLATSKSCVNMNTNTGAAASFYIVGTTIVVEANYCR